MCILSLTVQTWTKTAGCVRAFKSYDEAGVPRRIHCLKYLVLASMLMGSQACPTLHSIANLFAHCTHRSCTAVQLLLLLLQYLTATLITTAEQVDPFEAQEARPYKQDPDVLAMTNLVSAYQGNNIREFEKILATNRCCTWVAWVQAMLQHS